jgi:hypothetical protein
MVIAEVALALGSPGRGRPAIQTFLKLRDQYSGLQPQKVLTMRTTLSGVATKSPQTPGLLRSGIGSSRGSSGRHLCRLHNVDSAGVEGRNERVCD